MVSHGVKTIINRFYLFADYSPSGRKATSDSQPRSSWSTDSQPQPKRKNSIHQMVFRVLLVAEMGFEPHDLRVMSPTSYQTAPLRDIDGAGSRGRTGTRVESHGILSPGRLPIPPFRHIRSSVLLNYYITCDRDCQPFFAYF